MSLLSFLMHRATLGITACSAFALASCSDPVPPAAQGAFTAEFGNAPGNTCPATTPSSVLKVGDVTRTGKATVADGENGASVTCTVVPSPGGLSANGSISLGSATLTMSGVSFVGTTGTGKVLLRGSNTAGTYSPVKDSTCTFELLQGDAGRIWATFECPTMETSNGAVSRCAVSDGLVVFENCNTE